MTTPLPSATKVGLLPVRYLTFTNHLAVTLSLTYYLTLSEKLVLLTNINFGFSVQ